MYVANRVTRIRLSTQPNQWHYVSTGLNPADQATTAIPASELKNTNWFTGPNFLYSDSLDKSLQDNLHALVEPENDKEIWPEVKTLITAVSESQLSSEHFKGFSSWTTPCRAVARLIHVAASFKQKSNGQRRWKSLKECINMKELTQAENAVIRSVQQEVYKETFDQGRTHRTDRNHAHRYFYKCIEKVFLYSWLSKALAFRQRNQGHGNVL